MDSVEDALIERRYQRDVYGSKFDYERLDEMLKRQVFHYSVYKAYKMEANMGKYSFLNVNFKPGTKLIDPDLDAGRFLEDNKLVLFANLVLATSKKIDLTGAAA